MLDPITALTGCACGQADGRRGRGVGPGRSRRRVPRWRRCGGQVVGAGARGRLPVRRAGRVSSLLDAESSARGPGRVPRASASPPRGGGARRASWRSRAANSSCMRRSSSTRRASAAAAASLASTRRRLLRRRPPRSIAQPSQNTEMRTMPVMSRVSGGRLSVPPSIVDVDGVGELGGAGEEEDAGSGREQDEDDSEKHHAFDPTRGADASTARGQARYGAASQGAQGRRTVASASSSTVTAPGLVERLVAVAALRRLDAGRAPGRAGAPEHGVAGRAHPGLERGVRPLGEAGAARVAVEDHDRRLAGVGVQGGRDPADVPAVGGGDERQHPDGRVLGGVQRARDGVSSTPAAASTSCGHGPPDGLGRQRPLRQVERVGAQHLAGGQPPQEAGHLGRHPHRAERHLDPRPSLRALAAEDVEPAHRLGVASTSRGRRAPRARRAPRGRAR